MAPQHQLHSIRNEVVHTKVNDGRAIFIRSIRQSDEERMRAGIEQLSNKTRYLRFFSVRAMPPDAVIERLVDADGHDHIAWGAIHLDDVDDPAVGAVHAIRIDADSSLGEFSVAILDDYHGVGLGRMLTTVLMINCELEGICELDIQTLSDNLPAIRFVKGIGGIMMGSQGGVDNYRLNVRSAIRHTQSNPEIQGIRDIFAVFGKYLPDRDT